MLCRTEIFCKDLNIKMSFHYFRSLVFQSMRHSKANIKSIDVLFIEFILNFNILKLFFLCRISEIKVLYLFRFLLKFHSENIFNFETAEDRGIVSFITLQNPYQQNSEISPKLQQELSASDILF